MQEQPLAKNSLYRQMAVIHSMASEWPVRRYSRLPDSGTMSAGLLNSRHSDAEREWLQLVEAV
jgi:hypothetical protein